MSDKSGDAPTSPAETEMDLSALFQAIWKTRFIVIATALLSFLALSALIIFTKVRTPTLQVFQSAVQFVFPTIDKRRKIREDAMEATPEYPNGVPFAASDMIAPIILEKVYKENGLGKYGIKPASFYSSVSVQPYSPTYKAILLRYRMRLKNKRLTFVERKAVEQEMGRALKDASGKSAIIRLTTQKRIGVSDILSEKILSDIITGWADYSIHQRGVLKLPDLSRPRKLKVNLLETYNPVLVTGMVHDNAREMITKISDMRDIKGVNTVTDQKSGFSLAALLADVQNFRDYNLNSIKASLTKYQIADKTILLVTLQEQVKNQSLVESKYRAYARALEESLNLYGNDGVAQSLPKGAAKTLQGVSRNDNATAQGQLSPSSGSSTPQLSADFIDKIIAMTRDNKSEFFEALLKKRQLYSRMAVDAGLKKKQIEDFIGLLNSNTPKQGETANKLDGRLKESITVLNNYNDILGRLMMSLSDKRLSHSNQLYTELELTDSEKSYSEHPILNSKTYTLVLLLTLAFAILAMFASLIWQMIQRQGR